MNEKERDELKRLNMVIVNKALDSKRAGDEYGEALRIYDDYLQNLFIKYKSDDRSNNK